MSANLDDLLTFPTPQPAEIRCDDSMLVIVDMENEFIHPDGTIYLGDQCDALIDRVAALLERFRAAGSRVVFVRSVRSHDALEHTAFGRPLHLIENTWATEFPERLAPRAGEPVVEKRSHDCFNHTRMEDVIREYGMVPGRSQVVVTGVATDVCVDCAVVGFSVRDFRVYVPMDCTAGNSHANEWAAYQHFSVPAYSHNVTLTHSEMLAFR